MSESTHILYRFYDADGALLYVGITNDPGRRFGKHRSEKTWWSDVSRIDLEAHESRSALREAERQAIECESPRWNVRMNGEAKRDQIEWNCRVCNKPIADGEGYLTSNAREMRDYVIARAAWEKEFGGQILISLDKYGTYPNQVGWHAYHEKCDPDIDDDGYWISVDRLRTTCQVILWSSHLNGKNWILNTNWNQILKKVAFQIEGRVFFP